MAQLDWSYRFRRFSLVEHLLSQAQRELSKRLGTEDRPYLTGSSTADLRRFKRYERLRSELADHTRLLQSAVDDAHEVAGLSGVSHRIADGDYAHAVSVLAASLQDPLRRASGDSRLELIVALDEAAADSDFEACELIIRLIDAWFNFDQYDSVMMQPHGDAAGELEPTDIVRVSPVDAIHFVDESRDDANGPVRKLGGTNLANIGGFFAKDWRLNDLTWGRFDMAEILIREIVADPARHCDHTKAATDAIIAELADPTRDLCELGDPLQAMLRVNQFSKCALHRRAQDCLDNSGHPDRKSGAAHDQAHEKAAADRGEFNPSKEVVEAFRDLLHSSDSTDAWNIQSDLNQVAEERKYSSIDGATRVLGEVVRKSGKQPSTLFAAESLEFVASAAVGRPAARWVSWFLRTLAVATAALLLGFAFTTSLAASLIGAAAVAIAVATLLLVVRNRVRERDRKVRTAVPIAAGVFAAITFGALIYGVNRVGLRDAGGHVGAAVMVGTACLLLATVALSVLSRRKLRSAYHNVGVPRPGH